MAKFEYTGLDGIENQIAEMDRNMIQGIVMAGADACVKEMQAAIGTYHHVKTGAMQQAVAPGQYHEDVRSGWVEVYPQGTDSRGVDNAMKAFVINHGIGKRPMRARPRKKKQANRTGDKFITKNKDRMQRGVFTAMQAESDKLVSQVNNS